MLSERQILFRDYLIKKLGFVQDDFLNNYINQLEKSAPRYKYLGALPNENEVYEENGKNKERLKNGDPYKEYECKYNLCIPKKYDIIDFLNLEVKTKKNKIVKAKANSGSFVSATDLSNFTYCPVSYAISKTFDIVKIESAYHGLAMHEEQRLINLLPSEKVEKTGTTFQKPEMPFINSKNKEFFNEVFESKMIYNGHSKDNEKSYFKSKEGDYVGQPDYIFQNLKKEFFVVEEKFQYELEGYSSYEGDKSFYPNHVNQLLSYLHGIGAYNLKYGYLVYWKYDFDLNSPSIHSCYVLKITKSDETRNQLIKVYKKLKEFTSSKGSAFDIQKRNPNKCANCVSNLLCAHKTGMFNKVTYPYSFSYLKIYYAEFPKELSKDHTPDDIQDFQDLP